MQHDPGLLRSNEHAVGAVQRLADAGLMVITHLLAAALYGDRWYPSATLATAIGLLAFGFAAELGGLYRPWRTERMSREVGNVFVTWLAVPIGIWAYGFVSKTSAEFSRGVTLIWFVLAPFTLAGLRIAVRGVLRIMRAHGYNRRRVAILGATREAEELAAAFDESPWLGFELLGVFDDRGPERRHKFQRPDCRVLGDFPDLIKRAHDGQVDIVYVALPMRAESRNLRLFHELADTTATVYMVAGLLTYDLLHAHWSHVGSVPVVGIHDTPFEGMVALLKRVEDLVLGGIILALIALPMLAIAASIRLTSPGPVLFRQWRYGLNGRRIRVLKFRSMTVAEDGADVKQATRDDARVTGLGRFLRRTSLDELPQFLQVITGELSIVGPRPHAVAHNETYRSLIEGYMLRHMVKPGITGWAQVNGWRGETEQLDKMRKRVEHDLEYIRNWSLLWDIKIILMTVFGTKKNRNAY
jgi:putative colanic acid biosynthesis UDP-glucose lipid carrier transferase